MKALDFFCGAGGMTRGLLNANIEVVAGIDVDEKLRKTYEENNKPSRFIKADIREITLEKLLSYDDRLLDDLNNLLLAGCAPCQPFSQQRKAPSHESDATILGSFGKIVEQILP